MHGPHIVLASLSAVHKLSRTWASVTVGQRLSCPVTCGILVPELGIEPGTPALAGRVLTLDYQGSPLFFFIGYFSHLFLGVEIVLLSFYWILALTIH